MTFSTFIKSLMSGMLFPGVFLPFAYTVIYFIEPQTLQANPLQFIPMFIPLLFGLTNFIYLWIGDRCPISDLNARLWVTGICLGLIVAILGIFVFDVPTLIFGLTHGWQYLPIIFLPIIYGLIFRYVIKCINILLDI